MTSLDKLSTLSALGRWDSTGPAQHVISASGPHRAVPSARELLDKVLRLGRDTHHDTCGWSSSNQARTDDLILQAMGSSIYRATTPRGSCALFKTLYTNACNFDCKYCVNSLHNRRTYSYTPEELAKLFHILHSRGLVQGLFLSSGIGRDPDTTMEGMLRTVEILRDQYRFGGYVHLKVLPGASRYNVERAVQLADRVSLNVEAPSESRLGEIATVKNYKVDILKRQAWIKEISSRLPSGQTTQFVVGAAGETDLEIIRRMRWLYDEMDMRRVYYSAFEPIPGTELQSRAPAPSWREHRLYQVDRLYRVYRYTPRELEEALVGEFLPNVDPKITLARRFLDVPLDINEAPLEELLRVPGIGPLSARRISSLRRRGIKIRSRKQLAEVGVVLRRAQPFLRLPGSYQPTLERWLQPSGSLII